MEPDFELQMRSLAEEAQHLLVLDGSPEREEKAAPAAHDSFRPVLERLEKLDRAVAQNAQTMARLEEASQGQTNVARLAAAVQEDLDHKNKLNQKLFDALHDELSTYKDGFLLDVLHRPVACDLITFFDDLSELHRQTRVFLDGTNPRAAEPDFAAALAQVKVLATNLDHMAHSLLEVLARMNVHRAVRTEGKLDKRTQRVLQVERANSPEEDLTITASLKPGFIWRERTLRPEEVVVKRWRAEEAADPFPSEPQK